MTTRASNDYRKKHPEFFVQELLPPWEERKLGIEAAFAITRLSVRSPSDAASLSKLIDHLLLRIETLQKEKP